MSDSGEEIMLKAEREGFYGMEKMKDPGKEENIEKFFKGVGKETGVTIISILAWSQRYRLIIIFPNLKYFPKLGIL